MQSIPTQVNFRQARQVFENCLIKRADPTALQDHIIKQMHLHAYLDYAGHIWLDQLAYCLKKVFLFQQFNSVLPLMKKCFVPE